MTQTTAVQNRLEGLFELPLRAVIEPVPSLYANAGNFWPQDRPVRYIDLFSGIGGFHQASNAFGLECVLACDIDADARRAYAANYGIEPHHDVCALQASEIPDFDILMGGFPCQPFSIIGSREGFADARGTLFFEIARILEARKPLGFVLENVRQLSSHNQGKTLQRILHVLDELGYEVHKAILNALNFGLPQKRERVLIVGLRRDAGPKGFEFPSEKVAMKPLSEILEPDDQVDLKHFVSERIRASRLAAHTPKHRPAIWHENKAGNVSSHPFSCALRAGASYNYLLVNGERRLTPREMLRLQGFPDTFKIVCNDSATRKQAGNAVPVPMVQAVLARVLSVERA